MSGNPRVTGTMTWKRNVNSGKYKRLSAVIITTISSQLYLQTTVREITVICLCVPAPQEEKWSLQTEVISHRSTGNMLQLF